MHQFECTINKFPTVIINQRAIMLSSQIGSSVTANVMNIWKKGCYHCYTSINLMLFVVERALGFLVANDVVAFLASIPLLNKFRARSQLLTVG